MALLELNGVDAFYGRIQALRKISIGVEKGEVVALIGSNGAGKTTTLRTVSGLMHPQAGTIRFDGRDIDSQGTTVLLVEQNAHKALEVAHRGYVLETGSIVKTGTGQELLASEDVQKAYLGM